MKSYILILASLLVMAIALILDYQALNQERDRNRDLKLQLEQLSSISSSNVSQKEVGSGNPSKGVSSEILQLRGQISVLGRESVETAQHKAEIAKLRDKLFERLLGDRLKAEDVAPYLQSKQRSADSLFAAYATTADKNLLREAMQKYPNDPRINFAGYFAFKQSTSPEEKRSQLDAFRQLAPDNALADYMSAKEYFNTGQSNRAIGDIMAAAGKSTLNDYSIESMRGAEELYASLGFSTVQAKILSMASTLYPQLAELKGLGKNLSDMAADLRKSGDEASATTAAQMAAALGQRISNPNANGIMIQELVGIAIEQLALKGMNPASPYDNTGRTVQQRIEELNGRRESIKGIHDGKFDFIGWLQSAPEQDQLEYYKRLQASGEFAALTWAKSKQPRP